MAWLSGYAHRIEIPVAGSADGQQTNYQKKLTIVESIGSDAAGTYYLRDQALNWPLDIRFTKSDGETLLDFWREESDVTDGTWWVEHDSIAASPDETTFYLYYGKAGDSDASSGANTFITPYDGFERGINGDAIGGSWTVESGAPVISTDHAYGGTRSVKLPGVNSVAAQARINCAASANVAIRIRFYKETLAGNTPNFGQGNGTKFWNTLIGWGGGDTNGVYYYDTDARDTGVNITPDTWQLLEINNINFTAGTFDIWLNGSKIKTAAVMQTSSGYNGQIRLANYDFHNGYDGWVDDLVVRNWTANEPTWATPGAHESYIPSTIALGIVPTATRAITFGRASTLIIGELVTATRLLAKGIASTITIGLVTTASRVVGFVRSTTVLIGELITTTRLAASSRSSTIIHGIVVTASKSWGRLREAVVIIGEVVTTTIQTGKSVAAIIVIGVVTTAYRTVSFTRASTLLIGQAVTAARTWTTSRSSAVINGIVVTASKSLGKIINSTLAIGVSVTASKFQGFVKSAVITIGTVVTASRVLGLARAATVSIGETITASYGRTIEVFSTIAIGVTVTAYYTWHKLFQAVLTATSKYFTTFIPTHKYWTAIKATWKYFTTFRGK